MAGRLSRPLALQAANAELQSLARHDPLTGLLNRRGFDEKLQQVQAATRRHAAPWALLMVDADHFKRVNDRFGHDAGDAVLLPGTDGAGAHRVAEDIVARAAGTATPGVGVVTVSVGVVVCDSAEVGATELLRRADQALYAAENAGRNRAWRFSETALDELAAVV